MYYGNGPVFRNGDADFGHELNNNAFNVPDNGYNLACDCVSALFSFY